jgi:aspartyl-tRNA(Asn)/glutamyl-tRNA(Gln) amidotransferase subunit C
MISKEEVEHIAKLARLDLTGKEVEKMQKDMSAILDYFKLLKKVSNSEKIIKTEGNLIATRKDEIKSRDAGLAEKIIKALPDKKDDYIKVKAIF